MGAYEAITDWSLEGRAALVATRGSEIRLLLDLAFSELMDEPGTSLLDFGFRGDDPVEAAVEWCVARFESGTLDEALIRPESRSFRLFTEVSFWLSQKVGRQNVSRILARRARRGGPSSDRREPGDADDQVNMQSDNDPSDLDIEQARAKMLMRLSETLQALTHRTCADLAGYWLLGTGDIREAWFDWTESVPLPARTPKQRSIHVADALFRFVSLFAGALQRADEVCEACLFQPCDNVPPYRVADAVVRERLGLSSTREVGERRRSGVGALVRTIAAVAERPCDADRLIDQQLARHSLRDSLLHLYGLEGDATLRQALAVVGGHR